MGTMARTPLLGTIRIRTRAAQAVRTIIIVTVIIITIIITTEVSEEAERGIEVQGQGVTERLQGGEEVFLLRIRMNRRGIQVA